MENTERDFTYSTDKSEGEKRCIMNTPNYVIKTDEAVLRAQKDRSSMHGIKVTIWVILAIILLASFVFRENIFSELNWTARCLLFALAIGTCFIGPKKVNMPSPIELQFYDSCLVLYRPKRYYSPKVTRREINTMKYSDITKCLYKAESQRIHFYGTVDAKWFNFDKTGAMSKTPTYDHVVHDTLLYISTQCSDIDFVSEIEAHSPIRVTVENN